MNSHDATASSTPDNSSHDLADYACLLSITELGLGTTLHAWRIPLRGQILSINQIFILSLALNKRSKPSSWTPLLISGVGATIKSLSPTGARLTPMIAIAMQGALFNLGWWLGGFRLPGLILGTCLSATWSFIQPLLLYGLIFAGSGCEAMLGSLRGFYSWQPLTSSSMMAFIVGLVALKLVLSLTALLLAQKISPSALLSYQKFTSKWIPHSIAEPIAGTKEDTKEGTKRSPGSSPWRAAASDIGRPMFLLAVLFPSVYFAWQLRDPLLSTVAIARPLLLSYALFAIARSVDLKTITRWISRHLPTKMGEILASSLKKMERNPPTHPGD